MLNHTVEEPFKTYRNEVVHFFHEDGHGGRMIGKGEATIVGECEEKHWQRCGQLVLNTEFTTNFDYHETLCIIAPVMI